MRQPLLDGRVALGPVFIGVPQLAAVNLALVCVWLVIAVLIGRRYARLAAATR